MRGGEPARLTRLVRGEVDWIVVKALDKDRARRYETATGLAADVQRYLADEPVQACPPSVGYSFLLFSDFVVPFFRAFGMGTTTQPQRRGFRLFPVATRRRQTP